MTAPLPMRPALGLTSWKVMVSRGETTTLAAYGVRERGAGRAGGGAGGGAGWAWGSVSSTGGSSWASALDDHAAAIADAARVRITIPLMPASFDRPGHGLRRRGSPGALRNGGAAGDGSGGRALLR